MKFAYNTEVIIIVFKFTNTLERLEINIKANNNSYLYYYYLYYYYRITSTFRRTFFTFLQHENYVSSEFRGIIFPHWKSRKLYFFRRASNFAKIVVNFTQSEVYFVAKFFPEVHFLKVGCILN